MDTVLTDTWTTDRFLVWEDKQEGKHEFNGRDVIPMTGGSIAHQDIVFNLRTALVAMIGGRPLKALHEMRIRMGAVIRYADVVVCATPLDQATRTLTDALAIFEVLSEDTATTDRVDKLIDYAALPSLRCYVLLEQTVVGATVFQREPGGAWIATAHTAGTLTLPGVDIILPLPDLYRGLTFTG
ncbi:Uma2 family endonuclease [Rhodopila sp.]|uniref:Uma2 family endonuclease n=1 Tax=Rhodopila sp. TaxID=2480087 RepID=UPI003D0A2250